MDNVPDSAVALIAGFEGFRSRPYKDSGGTWTIGYGSTQDIGGRPITAQSKPVTTTEALALLKRDAQVAFVAVTAAVKVPLKAHETDALTSFCYNVGTGSFRGSHTLTQLNLGRYTNAANDLLNWDKVGGEVSDGLRERREKERELFLLDVAA